MGGGADPGHLTGAARIPPDHFFTLQYATEFGLQLDPFYPQSGLYLDHANGVRREFDANGFLATRPNYVKIRGGSDRLPLAFAAALGNRLDLAWYRGMDRTPVEFTNCYNRGDAYSLTVALER